MEVKDSTNSTYCFNNEGMLEKYKKVKDNFPKILESNMGLITKSCKMAGIDRGTYYYWRNKDEEFARVCDEIIELTGDFVESRLLRIIEAGNANAIIFYCKTKLRNRGYVERVEQQVTNISHEEWLKKLEQEECST